jgi:hypothetical protein
MEVPNWQWDRSVMSYTREKPRNGNLKLRKLIYYEWVLITP